MRFCTFNKTNGHPACPKCNKILGQIVDYGVQGKWLYFIRECKEGHGKYGHYTDGAITTKFTRSERVVKAIKVKTREEVNFEVVDGLYQVTFADGQIREYAETNFKKFFKVVDESKAEAQTDIIDTQVVANDAPLNVETKEKSEDAPKEPETPVYEVIPTVFQNKAGKDCLQTDIRLDDATILTTKENQSGSIYLVSLVRKDGAKDEHGVCDLTLISRKGSVEEVVKALCSIDIADDVERKDAVDKILAGVRQSRRIMRHADDIKAFYGRA